VSGTLAFHWTQAELAWAIPIGVILSAVIAAAASYLAGRRGSTDAIKADQLRIEAQRDLALREQQERRALSDEERAERRRLSFQERMWDRKVDAYDDLMHVCNQLTRSLMRCERDLFLNASDDLLRVVGPIAVLAPDELLPAVNGLQGPVWKLRYYATAVPDDLHFAHAMTPAARQNEMNELVKMVGYLFALMKRDLARDMEFTPVPPDPSDEDQSDPEP
jgi:hypothetical protein